MTEYPITSALISIIAHATEPMGVSDPRLPDNPMIAVNPAFETLTGYTAAATQGRNCRFLQGPATDREATARIRQCLEARRGSVEWLVNYRRDGSKFWNLLFMVPVFAPDGTLLHFFANQRDMSAEVPQGLPDYVLGKSDLPPEGEAAFHALLAEVLQSPGRDAAAELQAGIAAAVRLDEITTRLERAREI